MTVRQIVLRLAHRELGVGMSDGRAAFSLREHDGIRICRYHRVEVGVGQAGLQAVDTHEQTRPRAAATASLRNAAALCRACALLSWRDQIFKVDDQSVGTARHGLFEFLGTVGWNKRQRPYSSVLP